jgi:hypothetical protein
MQFHEVHKVSIKSVIYQIARRHMTKILLAIVTAARTSNGTLIHVVFTALGLV